MEYAKQCNWVLSFMRSFEHPTPGAESVDGIFLIPKQEHVDYRTFYPNAKIVDLYGWSPIWDAAVDIDHEKLAKMVADYLIRIGCRSFISIADKKVEPLTTRSEYFEKSLKANGFTSGVHYFDRWAEQLVMDHETLRKVLGPLLEQATKPLGIMASNDILAGGIIQTALDLGYDVPEDIAVIGVNNDDICESFHKPITSVDVSLSRVGYEGAVLMDKLLKEPDCVGTRVKVAPKTIVKRASTKLLPEEDPFICSVRNYIEQHYAEDISINSILEELQISRSTAFSKFTQTQGHTIGKEIMMIRMEHAKELLAETDWKIDAVARMVGYLNTSSFCRMFKKHTQMTPAAYRNKYTLPSE